jgi:hypothetical protein
MVATPRGRLMAMTCFWNMIIAHLDLAGLSLHGVTLSSFVFLFLFDPIRFGSLCHGLG